VDQSTIDFEALADDLLRDAERLVSEWLPGGKRKGHEWYCGSLRGEAGDSCRVNLNTGSWADFGGAEEEKGRDLISLFARINNIKNGEAARELMVDRNIKPISPEERAARPKRPEPIDEYELCPPPAGAPAPLIPGSPSKVSEYRSAGGGLCFYIALYIFDDGKKAPTPWSWSGKQEKWVKKAWTKNRPIYGGELLEKHPNKPVAIVEGEKCRDAFLKEFGIKYYIPISWQGGSKAWSRTDWKALKGRKILIWPDQDMKKAKTDGQSGVQKGEMLPYNDQPGPKCAAALANHLDNEMKAAEVKIIRVNGSSDKDGWDCADAIEEGWTWNQVLQWGKPRIEHFSYKVKDVQVHVDPDDDEDLSRLTSCFAVWDALGLEVSKQGSPVKSLLNACLALRGWKPTQKSIWYDEFHDKTYTDWGGDKREWGDFDTLRITRYLQDVLKLPFNDELVSKAVKLHASDYPRNEPLDWLKSLKWDGTARLEELFVVGFGATASAYSMAASKNFMMSMAARIARPGCKVDTMVILEGRQGLFKSTALEYIGGAWYSESSESVNSKDFFMTLQGKLVIEIGEMDTFNRAEATRIKQIISCRTDRFRRPYAREAQDYPRRCVFVGTTNDDHYLRDDTGGRRFWPIECTMIDLDWIKANRDQLFAEAYDALNKGGTWWEMPGQEAEAQQEERRQVDPWQEFISDWLDKRNPSDPLTANSALIDCLKMEKEKCEKKHSLRVGRIFKTMGYKSKVRSIGGKSVRCYEGNGLTPQGEMDFNPSELE